MRAWLGRSVLSESRMLFRAQRRREAHEAQALRREEPPCGAEAAREEVEALLATLDEEARRAVELRFLYDLDYREIGHVLGKSATACRIRVHRAVSTLRRRLGAHAAMLVAGLPHRVGDTSVSVPGAVASAPAVVAPIAVGGLAMAVVFKVAGVAAGAAVAGWLGWAALRPANQPPDQSARGLAVSAPAPGLAAAPARVGLEPRERTDTAADSSPAGDAVPSRVPLEAPIPKGLGSVAGAIRFTDGKPASGLLVALSGWTKVRSSTDAEGRFHLHGDWVADRRLVLVGPADYTLYLVSVAMKVDEIVHVDVAIERGVSVSGLVTDVRTRAPVADALLVMRRPGAGMFGQAGAAWVRTDATGAYRFDHVPADDYSLTCASKGHEFQSLSLPVAGHPVTQDLALRGTRSLIVRLQGLPEEAVGREMTVMFSLKPPAGRPDPMSSYDSKAPITADGTLTIDAPPVGEWRMTLFGDEVVPRFEQEVTVTAENVPSPSFVVRAGVRVTGVVHGPTGPLARASVSVGASRSVKTDGDGRFELPRVEPGRRTPYLHYDESQVRLTRVEIPAVGPAAVDLRVEGSAEVTATLVDIDVTGIYTEAEGEHVAMARPDAHGRVRIPYLAAGAYRLSTAGRDGQQVNRRFDLLPGQALDLGEIRVEKFPVVPVLVTVPEGMEMPLAFGVTVVRDVGGTLTGKALGSARIAVDSGGRGALRGLPPGEYEISIFAPGFRLLETSLVVREGLTAPLPLDLRRP
jgi:hypothetical protein